MRYVHAHPEEARALGLIVSIHGDVLEVPVCHGWRGWRLLDEDGRAVACAAP
jgi:hypothetical protein